jgi:5'-3' exonuclease
MRVHLVDGTYELFRHFYAMPSQVNAAGEEIAAARGVVVSMMNLLRDGATHVAVATDQIIESFRNDLWPGYKTGAGIDPALWSQFPIVEEALAAMGIVVWAMVEFEADDALAAGARLAAADPRVSEVLICTPDKDLGQCVGGRVLQLDSRRGIRIDEAGVRAKFGVGPQSIPDWLALVGDSADGYPGLPGWGAKSAAAVLARYEHLERIPVAARDWDVDVRGKERLAASLRDNLELAILFRRLATLRTDAPISESVDALEWRGPRADFAAVAERLEARDLVRGAGAVRQAQQPGSERPSGSARGSP